jgi:hypothetical protein
MQIAMFRGNMAQECSAKYVDQENNNPKKRKSSTVVG